MNNKKYDMETKSLKKDYDKWSSGLFDCYDDNQSCLETIFCHHCQMSRQYNKLKFNNQNVNYELCAFLVFLDVIFMNIGTLLASMKIRNMIHQNYNIYETDIVNELIINIFCTSCSICQIEREMKCRGEFFSLTNYYCKNNSNNIIQQEMK